MLDKFKIGHFTDETNGTGVTAIICEDGAVGGVSVRGAAPATRETDLLSPEKTVEKVNAVVLSGGSAFGLEASCGVMQYLSEQGKGFKVGKQVVPIVVGASIFDLEYKNFAFPDKAAGYSAAKNAKENDFSSGNIGAGTGATVGKLLGMECAAKAGLGVASVTINGAEVAVISVVNALGDVVDNGKIIAGIKSPDGSFLDSLKVFTAGTVGQHGANTTIGCVLTNAKITKVQANHLADLAHDGLARAISPSHTNFDGDAYFALASNEKSIEFNILTALVPQLTEKSIHAAVTGQSNLTQKKTDKLIFGIFQKMWK